MGVQKYEYLGEMKTIAELAVIAGIDKQVIRNRINAGWSVEDAAELPVEPNPHICTIDSKWFGKSLEIVFHSPVPQVFSHMQPILEKHYITTPLCGSRHNKKSKPYCIVYLENGKPLIVYPTEFEIIAEAPKGSAQTGA